MRHVELPPVKPLPFGGGKTMMIVVPTFTHREQGHPPVVFAGVVGLKTAAAPNMRSGVDEERDVMQKNSADEKSPHDGRESRGVQLGVCILEIKSERRDEPEIKKRDDF